MARRRQKTREKTPEFYFNSHKQTAKQRGIPWEFTFQTWWKVWEESGKYHLRGKRKGQYCMARNGDTGPYAPWNVSIIEVGINSSDGLKGWPEKKRARENGTNRFQRDRDQAETKEEATLDANELGLAARTFIEIGRKYQAA